MNEYTTDIREKAIESLGKEFDDRIKSKNGVKIGDITYKLEYEQSNLSQKAKIIYSEISANGQIKKIETEGNVDKFPENNEGNIIKERYTNAKNEYINLVLNHKPIEHYEKIVSKKLWNTLSEEKKEIFKLQINYLENMVLAGKAIKIRVNPKMIKGLQKILGVHDLKGGGYRGSTIYLGHASDLFNPQIVRHEGIHVLQQKELGGFVPWLIEEAKEVVEYKKQNKAVNSNINYDITSKIQTEAESYSNQLKKDYISYRSEKAFLNTQKNQQTKDIKDSNYTLDKNAIIKEIKNEKGVTENLSNLYHDLRKLDEIKGKGGDDGNSVLRIFNYIDKIEDITRVITILKKKLGFLQAGEKNSTELETMIGQCQNEIANENVAYMVEKDFTDINLLKKTIKELEQKCHELRKQPTCIRLEEPEQIEKWKSLENEGEEGGNNKNKKGDNKLVVVVPPIYQDVEYKPSFIEE